jgi:serine/threonine protein phosphatase PrpC
MNNSTLQQNHLLEWCAAARALPGLELSGDLHLVTPYDKGMLAAAVDGLGHGSEATAAAQAAIDVLKEHAGESIITLVKRCNEALRTTRGAVMTIVKFNMKEETATALGVGNVETVLLRANPAVNPPRENILLRSGLVGYQVPELHASVFSIHKGDLMVFATDGIQDDFYDHLNAGEPVQQLADRILEQKFRGTDDALVLAVRYLGKPDG